jgi:hypothetical protein
LATRGGLSEDFDYWKKGFKEGAQWAIPLPTKKIKAATRIVGGITKDGAKFVGQIYRNMGK